jgi:hypothetical protein
MTAIVFLFPHAAFATATSGEVYDHSVDLGSSTWVDACGEAIIADTIDNQAYIYAYDSSASRCSGTAHYVASGILGVDAEGFVDGTFCGATGYYYNNTSAYGWGVGAQLCYLHINTHAYNTAMFGKIWSTIDEYSWSYDFVGEIDSPSQNY